jgi:hypothetical protein
VRFEFESGTVCFTFIFVLFGESCLLVSWCAGSKCGMACSDKDHDRSRKPGAEDRDDRTGRILDGRAIERSGGAVCGLHRAHGDESVGFLVEPQNQGRWFISGLASKPLGQFFPVWTQNWWRRFSPVWP